MLGGGDGVGGVVEQLQSDLFEVFLVLVAAQAGGVGKAAILEGVAHGGWVIK